jgi:nucleoside 2-deoxyribosyltransferase
MDMSTRGTTFFICPVRGHDLGETEGLVEDLEAQGWTVHWPPRDTDQVDTVGLRICQDNLKAIEAADYVHVVWDGQSQGCLFDLGMAFALGKPVVPVMLPEITEGKSFQNMIRAWSQSERQDNEAADEEADA